MARILNDWFPGELPPGLTTGERSCLISSYSFLHCSARGANAVSIGHDTGIYHGSFFEMGPNACVQIGSFCTLVGAIIRSELKVSIGNYVFIAHDVVISDCESWDVAHVQRGAGRVPPGNCEPRPVRIGNDVWIGMRAVILAGVTVHDGAIIGAGAVVCEDVPEQCTVSGNPARVVSRSAP